MPLVDPDAVITLPETPPSPTPEQIYANTIVSQSQQMQFLYNQIVSVMLQIANFIYNNQIQKSDGSGVFTPQDYFNALGTDAVQLLALSQATLGIITAAGGTPPTLPPPGWNLTINGDGSVTASYTAPS